MEYAEYVIKFTCSSFYRRWNFAKLFLKKVSFRELGNSRAIIAITYQCVTYLSKAAPQMVALGLLNALIFLKKIVFLIAGYVL